MQKIEKWRVEELSLVLDQLAEFLIKGNNREWANVFLHFDSESRKIIQAEKFDIDELKKLVRNIKNCLSGSCSLIEVELQHENPVEKAMINRKFSEGKALLFSILEDLENRMVEFLS